MPVAGTTPQVEVPSISAKVKERPRGCEALSAGASCVLGAMLSGVERTSAVEGGDENVTRALCILWASISPLPSSRFDTTGGRATGSSVMEMGTSAETPRPLVTLTTYAKDDLDRTDRPGPPRMTVRTPAPLSAKALGESTELCGGRRVGGCGATWTREFRFCSLSRMRAT